MTAKFGSYDDGVDIQKFRLAIGLPVSILLRRCCSSLASCAAPLVQNPAPQHPEPDIEQICPVSKRPWRVLLALSTARLRSRLAVALEASSYRLRMYPWPNVTGPSQCARRLPSLPLHRLHTDARDLRQASVVTEAGLTSARVAGASPV